MLSLPQKQYKLVTVTKFCLIISHNANTEQGVLKQQKIEVRQKERKKTIKS